MVGNHVLFLSGFGIAFLTTLLGFRLWHDTWGRYVRISKTCARADCRETLGSSKTSFIVQGWTPTWATAPSGDRGCGLLSWCLIVPPNCARRDVGVGSSKFTLLISIYQRWWRRDRLGLISRSVTSKQESIGSRWFGWSLNPRSKPPLFCPYHTRTKEQQKLH